VLSIIALTDLVGRRTRDVDSNVLGTLHDLVVVRRIIDPRRVSRGARAARSVHSG
jgi:hypothetical protein